MERTLKPVIAPYFNNVAKENKVSEKAPQQRRKMLQDLTYMVETTKRELTKLKRLIKSKEDAPFPQYVQQTTPVHSDDQFAVEFQLAINEFGAMIAVIGDCRSALKSKRSVDPLMDTCTWKSKSRSTSKRRSRPDSA
jgi:hypothetical protein